MVGTILSIVLLFLVVNYAIYEVAAALYYSGLVGGRRSGAGVGFYIASAEILFPFHA